MGRVINKVQRYHQQIFESAPTGNPEDLEDFTGTIASQNGYMI